MDAEVEATTTTSPSGGLTTRRRINLNKLAPRLRFVSPSNLQPFDWAGRPLYPRTTMTRVGIVDEKLKTEVGRRK